MNKSERQFGMKTCTKGVVPSDTIVQMAKYRNNSSICSQDERVECKSRGLGRGRAGQEDSGPARPGHWRSAPVPGAMKKWRPRVTRLSQLLKLNEKSRHLCELCSNVLKDWSRGLLCRRVQTWSVAPGLWLRPRSQEVRSSFEQELWGWARSATLEAAWLLPDEQLRPSDFRPHDATRGHHTGSTAGVLGDRALNGALGILTASPPSVPLLWPRAWEPGLRWPEGTQKAQSLPVLKETTVQCEEANNIKDWLLKSRRPVRSQSGH